MPILRLLGILLRLPVVTVLWVIRRLGRRPRWVWLQLPQRVTGLPVQVPFWQRRLRPGPRSVALERLDRLTEAISSDGAVDGIVIAIPRLHAGWSTLGHLRDRLAALRAAGKRVVAYLPQGGGDREIYLAAAADRIVCSPAASVSLLGSAAGGFYLRDLLARLGLRAQVIAEGPYKTAAERLTSASMSDAEREQLSAVLASRQGLLEAALGGRVPAGDSAERWFEAASFSGQQAVAEGVVDDLAYEDAIAGLVAGGDSPTQSPAFERASAYERGLLTFFRPLRTPPYLGVVPIHGPISERAGWSPGGSVETTLAATVGSLRRVRQDKRALGVLLHVNSPGGSALVSDLIHHEVEALAGEKPVVAFFADVAASGGYYIPAAAHEIVAAPEAVTGSIGVISLKLVAEDLLDKLAVRSEVVKSAPHADMMSAARPLNQAEEAILARESKTIYRRFLEVVARGRKRPLSDIESIAGGRVWSAQDALSHGLVDALGGADEALERLRARIQVPAASRARLRARVVHPSGGPPPPAPPRKDTGPLSQAWESLAPWGHSGVQCLCPSALEIYLSSVSADAMGGLSAEGPLDYRWPRL